MKISSMLYPDKRWLIIPAIILLSVVSCKKEKQAVTVPPGIISLVFNKGAISTVYKERKEILVDIADVIDRKNLVAIFQLTPGSVAKVNGKVQHSSDTPNDFTLPVTYTISTDDGQSSDWTVRLESNTSRIGLGNTVDFQNRLTKDYEFYVGQDKSGPFSGINGGAACLAMALRWCDRTIYAGTEAADVRLELNHVELINSIDICSYLSLKGVPWKLVSVSNTPDYSEITECIDKGYLVLMCVDFALIPYNQNPYEHTGRFWGLTDPNIGNYTGHYIMIKGYMRVDGELYYEVYDPFSKNERYLDNGEAKGRNRYYHAEAVRRAAYAQNGWKYATIISEKLKLINTELKNEVNPAEVRALLNPQRLLYKYGF